MSEDAATQNVPTYVVIPGLDRHDVTYALLDQLAGQADHVFLYDNGSEPRYEEHPERPETVVDTLSWPLHRMWNDGLDRAAKLAAEAGVDRWNVAVLNNDLSVPGDFLAVLAAGVRARPNFMLAYPNVHDLPIRGGALAVTTLRGSGPTGRSLSGYAFMLRGEDGLRIDEQFEWWYGDDDLERQVHAAGGDVVCCAVTIEHLHPNESTAASPERIAMTHRDHARFFAKWGRA